MELANNVVYAVCCQWHNRYDGEDGNDIDTIFAKKEDAVNYVNFQLAEAKRWFAEEEIEYEVEENWNNYTNEGEIEIAELGFGFLSEASIYTRYVIIKREIL